MADSCAQYVSTDDLKAAKESILHIEHVATSKDANGNPALVVTDPIRGVGYTNATLDGLFSDIGFKPVNGSFEDGGTLVNRWDVLLYETNGSFYQWIGPIPVGGLVVSAGSSPFDSGGNLISGWVDRTELILRSDLASTATGKGDALIGVDLGVTGSLARTQDSKNRETVSIKDFAGTDTVALKAAMTYLASVGGGTVLLPKGTYTLGNIPLISGVSIAGQGTETTTVTPAANNTVIFDDNANPTATHAMICTIRGLSINCAAITGTVGIRSVNGNRLYVRDVNFYGCATNLELDRGGNHLLQNILSAPSSGVSKAGRLHLWSSDDTKYGAVFTTVDNYRIEGDSVDECILMRRAVGVKFNNVIVNDNSYDGTVFVLENDCQGILVNGGVIVGCGTGAVFRKGSGIDKAPIVNIFQNVDFDQCMQNSIIIEAGAGNQINGGSITSSDIATTTTAIGLTTADAVRNYFNNVSIAGYYGVNGTAVLINNATNNTFNNMIVEGCSQGWAFGAVATGNVINGGDARYNVTNPIVGSIAQAGISVKNLKGFRGSTVVATPTLPASGVAITNNFGVPVRVFINGGAVSLISINGVASGFTTGAMLTLEPGETLAVTYTTAPSWNWIGV